MTRVRAELGLDQPLLVQFCIYLDEGAARRFRHSVLTSQPGAAGPAAGLSRDARARDVGDRSSACVLGVPLGVRRGDRSAAAGRTSHPRRRPVGYSVPIFWLGLVGLLLFYAKLGWVGGPGRLDVVYDDIVTPRSPA